MYRSYIQIHIDIVVIYIYILEKEEVSEANGFSYVSHTYPLTYAHVCSRMRTYAHVCSRMQVEKVTQEGDGYVTLFSTPSGSKKV